MAADESAFKQELKESFEKIYALKMVWCPTDKIQTGVADIHMLIDKFYGIEAKFCSKLPKRESSKILSHPFSDKQVRFMSRINNTKAGCGIGIIYLNKTSALVVSPSQIDQDGNITRGEAMRLWKEADQGILKTKTWDIPKMADIARRICG